MPGPRSPLRLSWLEVVLALLVIGAFALAVERLASGRSAEPPGGLEAPSLAAEAWMELALATPAGKVPEAPPSEGVSAPGVEIRLGPGLRAGLERVEVAAAA